MFFFKAKKNGLPPADRAKPVVRYSPGLIEIIDPRVFGPDGAEGMPSVKMQLENVPAVNFVSIDKDRGRAEIRFPIDCSLPDVLKSVATALRSRSAETLRAEIPCATPAPDPTTQEMGLGKLPQAILSRFRKAVYLSLAGASFVMSIVGAIVPGIPTVPFLLLTSYFLVRSSPSLNKRLLKSRMFGPMIRDWQQYRGMREETKMWLIAFVLVTVALTLLLSEPPAWLLAIMFVMGSVGVYYIWRLPTVRADERQIPHEDEARVAFTS